MVGKLIAVYIVAIFLIAYGLRSFIAGLKNEKKIYWTFQFGHRTGFKKEYKDYPHRLNNILGGIASLTCGIFILISY